MGTEWRNGGYNRGKQKLKRSEEVQYHNCYCKNYFKKCLYIACSTKSLINKQTNLQWRIKEFHINYDTLITAL